MCIHEIVVKFSNLFIAFKDILEFVDMFIFNLRFRMQIEF